MTQGLKEYVKGTLKSLWTYIKKLLGTSTRIVIFFFLFIGLTNWLLSATNEENVTHILAIVGFSFTLCGLALVGSLFEIKNIEKESDDMLIIKTDLLDASKVFLMSGVGFIVHLATIDLNIPRLETLTAILNFFSFLFGTMAFSAGLIGLYRILDEVYIKYEEGLKKKGLR